MRIPACRVCLSDATELVLDLGHHPLADRFLTPAMLEQPEVHYPLRVYLCGGCGYAGLTHIVAAPVRYAECDYSYTASNSPVAVRHFYELATDIALRVPTLAGSKSLAVDIGGNDGTLLAAIARVTGCRVLNVEASPNMQRLSQQNGVPIAEFGFFGGDVASDLRADGGADLVVMTNTFNHISDPVPMFADIWEALKPGGMLVIEVPSAREILRRRAFDTIYLEHVSYFGLRSLVDAIMIAGNFAIEHAETVPYQGGSLRVWARKEADANSTVAPHVTRQIAVEVDAGTYTAAAWQALGKYAERTRAALETLLATLRLRRSVKLLPTPVVIAIGAAAKGNTMLNYCRLDRMIVCVVDTSPLKVGKVTPGSHIPIVGDDGIPADATHAVLLPWNIAGHMRDRYAGRGLEIIVPHELVDDAPVTAGES